MTAGKPRIPGKPDIPCQPLAGQSPLDPAPQDEEIDWEEFKYAFISPPKHLVGTTVPESVYLKLLRYPGGISQFYEDAVVAFDGDLQALLKAAAQFMAERKREMEENPVRNANGRVVKETFQKIESYKNALAGIRGMSRAKVLAGLIQFKFISDSQ